VLRFLVVRSSQLAQHATVTYTAAPAQEAERLAEPSQRVAARWLACAAAARTASAGRGQGRRGRPPKAAAPQVVVRSRFVVHAEAVSPSETAPEGTVLATPRRPEVCTDAALFQAYQDQRSPVEPGFRWSKHPAAIRPGWLEKPERMAALAMLTVMGVLG